MKNNRLIHFPPLRAVLRAIGLAGLLCFGALGFSRAAETENVDIRVQILSTKSLTVSATEYDFGALGVNASSVSASGITVTNNSTALIETYTIQATNAISDTAGTDWTLAPSTGPDQYSLSAQFSDSQPADNDAGWTGDALTTSPTTCTDTTLGNGTPEESGADVLPADSRQLWFRIKTPSAVTDGGPHTATVTISVL